MKQLIKIYIPVLAILTIGYFAIFNFHTTENNTPYSNQLNLYKKYGHLTYQEIEKLPKQDRPDLAALQHFEMTKDPKLGYPPVHRKIKAYEKLISDYKKNGENQRAIANVQWDERGPNNVGGRTRALMFDPNDATNKKVWAGAISGGLWVNDDITNETVGWNNVDDFMASLSIATLTYDPNNTNIFYLGTGERFTRDFAGLGIWKTADGGNTWNWLASTSEFSYVTKIVVTTNSTIIAATETGIKRSIDEGVTWSSPSVANVDMTDVELATNGDLFAGDSSGKIYKSSDDGTTWTKSSPSIGGGRVEIGISLSNSNIVYAIAAGNGRVGWFMKSTNGGSDWTHITIPMHVNCAYSTDTDFTRGQAYYNLIIGVHPTDPNIVIIGGINLYKTKDGGTSWDLISDSGGTCDTYVHVDQHTIVFNPQNPNEAIFGNDGGVYYSDNISAIDPIFIERNKDYNVTQFYTTAIVNEVLSDEFLAGSQDNGTQQFHDPDINSTQTVTGGDGAFCHIDQDNPNYQITSSQGINYYISRDRGASFDLLYRSDTLDGRFINPTEYDSDANIFYATGGPDLITRISNITSTPSSLEIISIDIGGVMISTIKASPYTNNRLFVGVDRGSGVGIIYQIDNADSATPIVTNVSINFDATRGSWVSSIDVGASDDQLLATFSNYGVHSIFETIDGGENWTTKEGNLSDIPVYSGLYNPYNREEVLIATELGVWSTDNFSATSPDWGTTNIGLANVSTRMLKYRKSDGLIAAATYGRGLFTTYSFAPNSFSNFSMSRSRELTYMGEVNFTNKSIGTINNLFWNFGDGYTSTASNPTHSFNVPGNYKITLDINDGISSAEKNLLVLTNRSIPYTLADGGDFENNINDFYAYSSRGTPFELGNSIYTGKNGTSSGVNAWVIGINTARYYHGTLSYLQTPAFDFSSAGNYSLSFKAKYKLESEGATGAWDAFWVEYSTDNGNNWQNLGDAIENNWYNQTTHHDSDVNQYTTVVFSGTSSGFETFSKDISDFSSTSRVAFRIVFMAHSISSNVGLAIDDFEISGPISTPIPNFASTNPVICNGGHVIYNDLSAGSISNYSWNFGVGATPETVTGSGPHDVVYTAQGSYTTTLTVTGVNGNSTISKNNYVVIENEFLVDNVVTSNINEFNSCQSIPATITVGASTFGVEYQLFNGNTNNTEGDYLIGNGADLIFTTDILTDTTTYFIQATDTLGCSKLLESSLSFNFIGPNVKYVTSNVGNSTCIGNTLNITVVNSEPKIIYKLIDQTNNSVITSQIGDGNDLIFSTDTITQSISWAVIGSTVLNDCSILMGEQYIYDVFPYPDATITQNGSVMEVPIPSSGAYHYQWHLNGLPIIGATKNSYDAIYAGTYVCVVNVNGCVSYSQEFTTSITSIGELNSSFKIFPNPTFNGVFNVESKPNSTITIFNTSGKVVYLGNSKSSTTTIDLCNQANGMYIIEIINDQHITKHRINIMK